jgi:hypothetical protein
MYRKKDKSKQMQIQMLCIKVKHGLRYTQLRGLAKVTMQVTLTFACMNLKKLAKWKRISSLPVDFLFSWIYKTTHSFDFAGSEWFWSTVCARETSVSRAAFVRAVP